MTDKDGIVFDFIVHSDIHDWIRQFNKYHGIQFVLCDNNLQ